MKKKKALPRSRQTSLIHHDWLKPELATRSGTPLAWCRKCGTFSPTPQDIGCAGPASMWAYETSAERQGTADAVPLRADVIVERLAAAIQAAETDK